MEQEQEQKQEPSLQKKKHVVILGGGCGAMSTAFALTATEELRQAYDVTIYQHGWRLGGKGATGRNLDSGKGKRIEEHGIHVWLGSYEHSFRMIRDCYLELEQRYKAGDIAKEFPFKSIEDAFEPQYTVTFQEQLGNETHSDWETWNIRSFSTSGTPGDGTPFPTLYSHISRLLRWMREELLRSLHIDFPSMEPPGCLKVLTNQITKRLKRSGHSSSWDSLPGFGALDVALDIVESLGLDETLLRTMPLQAHHKASLQLVTKLLREFQEWLQSVAELLEDISHAVRRTLTMLDISMAVIRGLIVDILPSGKFETIDHLDLRDWLQRHGASEMSLWSAPMRAIYDMVFSYPDGNAEAKYGQVAAGTAIHGLLLMFLGFKGAPLWKMKAGMGDTIFAPLYLLLKARGVKFEFFRRVKSLTLSSDKQSIDSIEIDCQANTYANKPPYQPLSTKISYMGKELDCWPSEPDWTQLRDNVALRKKLKKLKLSFESHWYTDRKGTLTLQRRTDNTKEEVESSFDYVVLGISIAALPSICKELVDANDDWRVMLSKIKTVATQSFQIWTEPSLKELGWTEGPTTMAGYARPFDSWSEESLVLDFEEWPGKNSPKAVEYFSGCLRDPSFIPPPGEEHTHYPASQHDRVKQNAMWWLQDHAGHLWPHVGNAEQSGFQWDCLFDAQNKQGPERFNSQYWKANIDPSERYVLSVPGSVKYRMAPGDSGFDNLYLAGDWTRTQINGGSVEAATESGLLAAQAIISDSEDKELQCHKVPCHPLIR